MRIIIDADACPKGAKAICEEFSNEYKSELIMVIDSAHELEGNYKVIKVGKGNDAVDMEIIRISEKNDIIITQDYGLASIVLDKVIGVINPSGFEYTRYNIDLLMYQRFMGQKMRNAGKRTKGPKKRTENNDEKFRNCLENVIKKVGQNTVKEKLEEDAN